MVKKAIAFAMFGGESKNPGKKMNVLFDRYSYRLIYDTSVKEQLFYFYPLVVARVGDINTVTVFWRIRTSILHFVIL